MSTGEWLDGVAERLNREISDGAAPTWEKTTGRELLTRFGYARRGRWVVSEIRNALEKRGLQTNPDFEFEWVDNEIQIILDGEPTGVMKETPSDPTVCVGILPAAHNVPVSVKRDDPLEKATSIMQIHDYSQVPVINTNDRDVKGAVTWSSIGAAHAQGKNPSRVGECMEQVHVIDMQTPLSDAVDTISKHDFVLVQDKKRSITGIVTAIDLAHEFKQQTYPFLLIGEIEHHLRNLIRGKYSVEELAEASLDNSDIRGPDDLSFGGYCRLLQREIGWMKLGIEFDRNVFVSRLESLRIIRNDILHFSPEPYDISDINQLECMARLCRKLTCYERE